MTITNILQAASIASISVTFRPVAFLLTVITGYYNVIAPEILEIVKCNYMME